MKSSHGVFLLVQDKIHFDGTFALDSQLTPLKVPESHPQPPSPKASKMEASQPEPEDAGRPSVHPSASVGRPPAITAEQVLDDGGVLNILVEKDFACLAPREGEDESDMFPHPLEGQESC